MATQNPLFTPLSIGTIGNNMHRVALAPLTRMRADEPGLTPRKMHIDYYSQRYPNRSLRKLEITLRKSLLNIASLQYTKSNSSAFRIEQKKILGAFRERHDKAKINFISHTSTSEVFKKSIRLIQTGVIRF